MKPTMGEEREGDREREGEGGKEGGREKEKRDFTMLKNCAVSMF